LCFFPFTFFSGSTGIDVGFINQIIVQCLDSQWITDRSKKKL